MGTRSSATSTRVAIAAWVTSAVHRTHRLLAAVAIVVRHIVGYVFGLLRLDRLVQFGRPRSRVGQPPRLTGPEHARLVLEELGVASIKIGQILSTRTDLLAPAYQVELAKLHDSAPPEPTAVIRDVLATELGSPIETVFAEFDPQPIAAASIGQVHAATLPDGSEVVVKIRRPGVVEQIELDLQILEATVRPISRMSRAAWRYDLDGLVEEFATTLRSELDYQREASNVERFAANFADDPSVHIPRAIGSAAPEGCSPWSDSEASRSMTSPVSTGGDRPAGARPARCDRDVADDLRTRLLPRRPPPRQLLHRDRRAHRADRLRHGRHRGPGDTCRVARRSRRTRRSEHRTAGRCLRRARHDHHATRPRPARPRHRQPDLRHLSLPLAEISLGTLLRDLFAIIRRHRLRLPPNLAALAKTLAMSEGIAAQLDPSFEMTTAIAIYLPVSSRRTPRRAHRKHPVTTHRETPAPNCRSTSRRHMTPATWSATAEPRSRLS